MNKYVSGGGEPLWDLNFSKPYTEKRFFESQLPELIKSINRLADAIEEQNEIKEEERKNEQQ